MGHRSIIHPKGRFLTMSAAAAQAIGSDEPRRAVEIAREIGPLFARRASEASDEDRFVADNFATLKDSGLVEAGVPADLGGGGADIDELAAMLRALAYHCGSTALAFSMHTHQVAVPAWRWTYQKAAPVKPLLERIAKERILLLSSGGSDWIAGSGKAEKVDGGYRINARKIFTSGAPTGDILMTGAVLETENGPEVLHFGVPMSSPNVKVLDTWRTLGMRATGSHDVLIDGHVVPDTAVAVRRRAGEWHPLFHIIGTIAFPLVYAVYVGVAESARDLAVQLAKRKTPTRHTVDLAGRMDTELAGARLALESMLAATRLNAPSAGTINQVMIGKQLVTRHAIAAVELAMQLAGGVGFYRSAGLERKFRDIQAARYHPLQSGPQAAYAGAMALGLPVERIF
jgi:alkylation response protein AidB-like acyl-CoA dehydrogenase